MQNEFEYHDTGYTTEIICPYCGYEFTDSWEVPFNDNNMDDERKIECHRCDEEFTVIRRLSVDYSTFRDPKKCQHPDQKVYCDYCAVKLPDATSPVAK